MQAPRRNWIRSCTHLIVVYFIYLKIYFKTLVEYRVDTWIAVLTGGLAKASGLIFIGVIFQRIPKLAGWSLYELLFIYGLATTARSLNQVFLNAPFSLHSYIRRGELDTCLIRPVGTLFQVIGISQEINGLGNAVIGFFVLGYSAANLGIDWTIDKAMYLFIAIVSSVLIQFAVLMIIVIPGFWVFEIRSIVYPVVWLYDFACYPQNIFNPFVRVLLTYVFPYALGSFYPAAYLLDPVNYQWALWGVPATAIGLSMISYVFWRYGLRHYSSASGLI